MQFSGKVYNFLKWFCLIALPAFGVFLSVVLPAVGIPNDTTRVITTILSAVGTLIGSLIGVSTKAYNNSKK